MRPSRLARYIKLFRSSSAQATIYPSGWAHLQRSSHSRDGGSRKRALGSMSLQAVHISAREPESSRQHCSYSQLRRRGPKHDALRRREGGVGSILSPEKTLRISPTKSKLVFPKVSSLPSPTYQAYSGTERLLAVLIVQIWCGQSTRGRQAGILWLGRRQYRPWARSGSHEERSKDTSFPRRKD